jgi:glycosyltransferase involved in cell wall biosynthesis
VRRPPADPIATADDARRPHLVVKTWRDRWNPDAGGAEVWLDEVLTRLARRGWRVTVLTMAYEGRPRSESVEGVRYVRAGGVYSQYLAAHRSQRRLADPPDVMLDVFNGVPFLSVLSRRHPTVVVVHHVHRDQWPMVFGPLVARAGWFLERRVAARLQRHAQHVTVSEASARDLADIYGVDAPRITVAHNGFTPSPAILPASLAPARRRLVTVGRLVPHKRVEVAVQAVARGRSQGIDVHLDVVGAGAWGDGLRTEAERLGVSEHVSFHGWVDDARKHAILAASDLLLLPSVREGWGLVVIEAAQHGVPAIALASAGGTGESILDGVTGELASDDDDLIRRSLALLRDDVRREACASAARALASRFTWEACAAAVETAIRRALADHARESGGRAGDDGAPRRETARD